MRFERDAHHVRVQRFVRGDVEGPLSAALECFQYGVRQIISVDEWQGR